MTTLIDDDEFVESQVEMDSFNCAAGKQKKPGNEPETIKKTSKIRRFFNWTFRKNKSKSKQQSEPAPVPTEEMTEDDEVYDADDEDEDDYINYDDYEYDYETDNTYTLETVAEYQLPSTDQNSAQHLDGDDIVQFHATVDEMKS